MNAGPNTLPGGAQTISVQQQGRGVWALFVQPVDPALAVDVVASLAGRMVELGDGEYLLSQGPISEKERSRLPSSLLAAPHEALPKALGVRLGLSLSADGHAVFLSRNAQDLAQVLAPLLSPSSPHPAQVSTETLLDWAGDEESWVELSQVTHRGHRVLELRERIGTQTLRHERWVAPKEGGHWRAGWSW
ncbi:MAG: hypothetical protein ACI9VR_001771 [Cognaticolwellia sp.]|jgi:hypothetical protein